MEVDGKTVRASYGTTKYCTYYLRHMSCPNPNCMYLHEPGDDVDSYSKDTVAIGKHANTASTSTTTSAYPNKRPATAAKPTTATATIAPTATPESKPATAPRTWAPIPKVVPIPPVVIPKEEPTTPPPPSPPFQEIKSSSSTKHSKPTASSSSSTSTTKLNATPKVHKKPAPTEKHTKKLTIPLVPEEDEKPALPATASWAKTQPVVNHENVITPANFGPSLSDALNAPQKPKHSPSLKVKKEKKSKGKMVRLEEFEEAEREAKMAASRPKVVPKPEVAPIISPVVAPSVTPATVSAVPKSPSPVKAESAIPETKQAEKSNAESKLVSEERKEQDQSSSSGEKEKELQKVSSEDIVETPVSDEAMPEMLEVKNSNAVQPSKEQSQLQKEDIPVELEQPTPQPDAEDDAVTAKEEETPQNQPPMEAQEEALIEENGEKMENLASLNDTIIKAFDDAAAAAADESSEKVQSDETSQQPQDAVTDATQPEMDEQKLAQNISSPLAAMDRLSALVQQEIMVDSPEQPSFDAVQQSQQPMHQPQPQQPHPGMNRFDLGMPMQPDNRRMAPPGLSGPPPPPPEWINRSFDPFNGQDPSLIAARRLQHSQRMLEASGLFAGGGFGHPPVPRFGFSPDFNRGPSGFMPHQAPPPPPMGMFPPPPPPHPMMRHAPPLPEMLNMQSPFGPPPPQLQQQQQQHIEELRNEFNGMNMNGNDEHHQQSRDDLRALLPNVKISFNNLQEKRRAEEFYQQQLIMQRQQQMQQQQMQQQQMQQQQMQQMQQQQQHIQRQHQYQQEPKMSEQEQIPTRLDNSDHNITSSPSRHASFTETSSPLQSVQEKVLLKSPMNQQWQPNQFSEMVEKKNNPDVRVEAQNFFGEFLRKAASSTQQQEMSPKRDEPSLQPAGKFFLDWVSV
ncbi:transcriptional repressor general negative regulator of transcription subunit 4 [Mucor circinelloides]